MPEVSTKSIQDFIDKFFDTYNKMNLLKKIFEEYGHYEKSKEKHPIEPKPDDPLITGRYAIKKIEDKNDFLHFPPGFGPHYAKDLAWMGEFYIFIKLKNKAKKILKKDKMVDFINSLKNLNQFIILISGWETVQLLYPNLRKNHNGNLSEIGYCGEYFNGQDSAPVFKLEALRRQNFVIVINRSSMGKIIQYPPNDIEKGESSESCKYHCYPIVEPLEENCQLMQQLLQHPPEWLQKEYPSTSAQRIFLSKHVYVEIRERFHYFEDPNPEIYLSDWM